MGTEKYRGSRMSLNFPSVDGEQIALLIGVFLGTLNSIKCRILMHCVFQKRESDFN